MAPPPVGQPTIFVSSTVFGLEDTLEQVYAALVGYGYTVWMSHKGTVPIDPGVGAIESCLAAVRKADVFFGIINGRYGSGREGDELAATHREILEAVASKKPTFFAVHRDVTIARQVLRQFRNDDQGRAKPHTFFKKTAVLEDIRVIDMYEVATRADLPLPERIGNWVQQYQAQTDLLLFVKAQFEDRIRIQEMCKA